MNATNLPIQIQAVNSLERYKDYVYALFKDQYGNPFKLTDGQAEIFKAIYEPEYNRVVIRTITQYGKSETASMAILLAAVTRREKIAIVAPKEKQANIIMSALITHIFDNELIKRMLTVETTLERLKQEKSKKRITFINGSEIAIITANVDTLKEEGKGLMGFGATMVLVDESSLIPDIIFGKILRMVGGQVYEGHDRGKLIQLGNPFERNHFFNAFRSVRYYKIIVKKEQALKEGRITQEFLDEAKETTTPLDYLIFYECEFPELGAEDSLIPYSWIEAAVENPNAMGGDKKDGLDIARFGKDKSVFCFKEGFKFTRLEVIQNMDTMSLVGWASRLLDSDGRPPLNLDIVGIGSGVYDRMEELGEYEVNGINAGESPTTDEAKKKFTNLRAELFWDLRETFKLDENGQSHAYIPDDAELKQELSEIRYGYSSDKKIKVESKDEMKKRIGRSPDKADAVGLANFNYNPTRAEVYFG